MEVTAPLEVQAAAHAYYEVMAEREAIQHFKAYFQEGDPTFLLSKIIILLDGGTRAKRGLDQHKALLLEQATLALSKLLKIVLKRSIITEKMKGQEGLLRASLEIEEGYLAFRDAVILNILVKVRV
jgi:hypothetical protein